MNPTKTNHYRLYLTIAACLIVSGFLYRAARNGSRVERVLPSTASAQKVQSLNQNNTEIGLQAMAPTKIEAQTLLSNTDINRAIRGAKDLHLTDAQLNFMQARYDVFLDQERQLEARIAITEIPKPGEVLITIPAHSEAGNALYSQFEAEMSAYLGSQVANDFFNDCGQTLSALNADFGSQERQILVDRNGNAYHIVDKVAYTTIPGLLSGVTSNGATRSMVSDLAVGGDLGGYSYLATNFP
jgi:hypothetical protein